MTSYYLPQHCFLCDHEQRHNIGDDTVSYCTNPVLRGKGTIDTQVDIRLLAKCKLLNARSSLFHSSYHNIKRL